MAEREDNRHEDLETLSQRLTPEKIDEVDSKYPSPRVRASRVLTILEQEDLTRWDYLCFSIEFLGQFAIAHTNDKLFYQTAKFLGKWLYNLHYFYPDEIYEVHESASVDQDQSSPAREEGSSQSE